MAQAGVYSPETARIVLETVRYLRESGFIIKPPGGGQQSLLPFASPIYVRNDSGEEIPAFACMQVTGTVDAAGQNYITVDKPADTSGADGWYLFNSIAPIEIDGYGLAEAGPLVKALGDGSSVTCGAKWRPKVGQWYIEPGGATFSAVGDYDADENVIRIFSSFTGIFDVQVKVDGSALQKSTDAGLNWTDWATIGVCS